MQLAGLAREIYDSVKDLPIISPHGHVDPILLLEDLPLGEPSTALIRPDHYITRLMHTHGFDYRGFKFGSTLDPEEGRSIFLEFARFLPMLAGTTVAYWLDDQFKENFLLSFEEVIASPSQAYDKISVALLSSEFTPSAILNRANVAVLATTDSYSSDITLHRKIAEMGRVKASVKPAFRPEGLFDIGSAQWLIEVERLSAAVDIEINTFSDLKAALWKSIEYFVENGAISIDISPRTFEARLLSEFILEDIFFRRVNGGVEQLSSGESEAFMANMTYLLIELACDFSLPITLHPGIIRNHHLETLESYGQDKGGYIPRHVLVTDALSEVLNRFGRSQSLKLTLFTVDETIYSRELAPLAGFYPSTYIGYPWWFIDSPQGLYRFFDAVVPQVGFYKLSGFIDDTRALLSIPTRHKMARLSEASYLAKMVEVGYLTRERAFTIALDLVTKIPRRCFSIDE